MAGIMPGGACPKTEAVLEAAASAAAERSRRDRSWRVNFIAGHLPPADRRNGT
jgi:hypothetical protein